MSISGFPPQGFHNIKRFTVFGSGSNFTSSTNKFLDFDQLQMSSDIGYVMPRAGSVVGLGIRVINPSANGTVVVIVRVNDTDTLTINTTAVSEVDISDSTTVAAGTHTYVAGDLIAIMWSESSKVNADNVTAVVELEADT